MSWAGLETLLTCLSTSPLIKVLAFKKEFWDLYNRILYKSHKVSVLENMRMLTKYDLNRKKYFFQLSVLLLLFDYLFNLLNWPQTLQNSLWI